MNITKENLLNACKYPANEAKLEKLFIINQKKHPHKLKALIHRMIIKNKLTKTMVNNEVYYESTSDTIELPSD
jgi:hypothetical protein